VREHGEYNASHIPGFSSVPRRLIEFRLQRLVPCADVPVVICDDDGQRAALAAETLEKMGYTNVAHVAGGISRWASEGLRTEWGMNVPSKAFGERIEVEHDVRTIHPLELSEYLRSGQSVLILDSRTPEEYRDFCIPGGRSLPGGELAYRIGSLVQEQAPDLVVVNCAGRTRSIIGARILQRMGVANVVSLKNGTAGWTLAGLQLEQGADRTGLPEPDMSSLAEAERFAIELCAEDGVQRLNVDDFRQLSESGACIYQVDVRTEAEYAGGHVPSFSWFPGGQAVQRADDVVGVRSAHIVFCCNGIVRAAVAGSWFRQMGFPNVSILDGGTRAWVQRGLELASGPDVVIPFGLSDATARVRAITPSEIERDALVLHVGTSREFAHGHVAGAQWLSRSWLEPRIASVQPDRGRSTVVTDSNGQSAALAACTLQDLGYTDAAYLEGGMRAWIRAGLPIEKGLSGVMQPPDDVVLGGLERSPAEAIEYLRWETALAPLHPAHM
jgi:rhodanese-related sulfurtransferase